MLRIKRLGDDNNTGFSVIILWLFAISSLYTMDGKGDHLTLGLCVGPCEVTFGFSLWRKILP